MGNLDGYDADVAALKDAVLRTKAPLQIWNNATLTQDIVDERYVITHGWAALLHFAANGRMEAIIPLLRQGANVNVVDKNGCTPLHAAASKGNVRAMEILLNEKANVNVVDKNGCTPLHAAASKGDVRAMEMLLNKKANVNIVDKNGCTSLHVAASKGDVRAMEMLLNKEANVNVVDKNGFTPLHAVASKGDVRAIEMLLNKKANVNVVDKNGCTPLHLAASNGDVRTMEILLNKEATIGAPDKDGLTPLHVAASKGNVDACKLLLRKGANFEILSIFRKTALDLARETRSTDVVNFLQTYYAPELSYLNVLFSTVELDVELKYKYRLVLVDAAFTTEKVILRLDSGKLERLGVKPGHAIEIEDGVLALRSKSALQGTIALTGAQTVHNGIHSASLSANLQSSYFAFFSYAQADADSETSILYRKAIERFPVAQVFHDANTGFALGELVERVKRSKNVIVMLSYLYPRRPWAMIELHHALRSRCKVTTVRLVKPTPFMIERIWKPSNPMFDFAEVSADISGGKIKTYMTEAEWRVVKDAGLTEEDVMENLRKVMDVVAVEFSSRAPLGVQDAMMKEVFDRLV